MGLVLIILLSEPSSQRDGELMLCQLGHLVLVLMVVVVVVVLCMQAVRREVGDGYRNFLSDAGTDVVIGIVTNT